MASRCYDRELKCGCLISADGGGGLLPCSYPEVSTEEELQKCTDAWKEWQQTDDYKLYKEQVQERNQ